MLPLNLFLRAYFILFGLASTTFTYRLINVLWLFNWPCNFSFLIVIVLKQDSLSSLNPLTTEHQPYLTQYFTSGEPLHSKQHLSTAFFITIPLGGFWGTFANTLHVLTKQNLSFPIGQGERHYSQLFLRRTPWGPAVCVRLTESQIKDVKKGRDQLWVSVL